MKGKSTVVISDYLVEVQKLFEQGLKETPKPELPFFNTMVVALATSLRYTKAMPFFNTMTEKYGVRVFDSPQGLVQTYDIP